MSNLPQSRDVQKVGHSSPVDVQSLRRKKGLSRINHWTIELGKRMVGLGGGVESGLGKAGHSVRPQSNGRSLLQPKGFHKTQVTLQSLF